LNNPIFINWNFITTHGNVFLNKTEIVILGQSISHKYLKFYWHYTVDYTKPQTFLECIQGLTQSLLKNLTSELELHHLAQTSYILWQTNMAAVSHLLWVSVLFKLDINYTGNICKHM